MITIQKSATADTRTCDYANVSPEVLLDSSIQHIQDVNKALVFFERMLTEAGRVHDTDKITDIDSFHADFVTGFAQTGWWDRHRKLNRHHLTQADGIPDDVNLIDVLDFIADCVMAGMARSGTVYELQLPEALLDRAFHNTVKLLKANVKVVEPDPAKDLCTLCGARRESHTDVVDGRSGHRIDMPGMPQHGAWHEFTTRPLYDDNGKPLHASF